MKRVRMLGKYRRAAGDGERIWGEVGRDGQREGGKRLVGQH